MRERKRDGERDERDSEEKGSRSQREKKKIDSVKRERARNIPGKDRKF